MATKAKCVVLLGFFWSAILTANVISLDTNKADYGERWLYEEEVAPGIIENPKQSEWCHKYPACCFHRQSPIEVGGGSQISDKWRPLRFDGYHNVTDTLLLENTGHTVNVYQPEPWLAGVEGGGLKGYYMFHSLHFHWGKDNTVGAEHSIYGNKFPLEMHLVHIKNTFTSLNAARNSEEKDAVAVFAVLFHISSKENAALKAITSELQHVADPNRNHSIEQPLQLSDLLPRDLDHFYFYLGSFTTPGCEEVVAWTIFKWSLPVTSGQLEAFRSLYEEAHAESKRYHFRLANNFRPLQPITGRCVYDVTTTKANTADKSNSVCES